MLGSVALAVVARAERPVVLVRATEDTGQERRPEAFEESDRATPYRDVVLGLDLRAPDDHVLEFAFDAASRRAARLRVIHGWGDVISSSAFAGDGGPAQDGQTAAAGVLRPWRDKFPGVEVTEEAVIGGAGAHLVDASHDASLIVVGRRNRTGSLGSHIGPVATRSSSTRSHRSRWCRTTDGVHANGGGAWAVRRSPVIRSGWMRMA